MALLSMITLVCVVFLGSGQIVKAENEANLTMTSEVDNSRQTQFSSIDCEKSVNNYTQSGRQGLDNLESQNGCNNNATTQEDSHLIKPIIANVEASPESRQDIDRELTRGEAVSIVVKRLDLENKKIGFITDCYKTPDECFFAFSARSGFDGINFSPLTLYPDVYPSYEYYHDINVATTLGIVQGFLGEKWTPFKPMNKMTRVQALKVVMGAAGTLNWKEKFEMTDADKTNLTKFIDLGSFDSDAWWYTRYVNKAVQSGIISEESGNFNPDKPITEQTLNSWLLKVNQ